MKTHPEDVGTEINLFSIIVFFRSYLNLRNIEVEWVGSQIFCVNNLPLHIWAINIQLYILAHLRERNQRKTDWGRGVQRKKKNKLNTTVDSVLFHPMKVCPTFSI